MHKCIDLGISISYFTSYGKYLASVNGSPNGNVLLRRQQYRYADNEDKKMYFAKLFIEAKIYNARWVLERGVRDHSYINNDNLIKDISINLAEKIKIIENCSDINVLRGIEGDCAKQYFSVFDQLILKNKDYFVFTNRNKRPPKDAVNALLSFTYSILTNEVASALSSVGLDPYVGFMHTDRPGRKSLASDLVEELRAPFADRFILTGINLGKLKPSMFTENEDNSFLLNENGRKVLITEWQNRKKETITHPFIKEKIEWGMVPYVQAQLLARAIRSNCGYVPFFWK